MVRVKNRYLVVNFLYPALPSTQSKKQSVPNCVQFHAPTPDAFHQGLLLRMIRDGITELFGDYGMGMMNNALKGTLTSSFNYNPVLNMLTCKIHHSQLLVSCNLNCHYSMSPG